MKRPLFLSSYAIPEIVAPSVLVAQPVSAQEKTSSESPISAIPQTSEKEHPLTEAKWLTQASPPPGASKEQVAQLTAVQLKPTNQGLEVILETAAEFPEVLTSSAENSLITDIPNAQLRLPRGGEFRQDNPTNAIASVIVSNLDAKTIRVKVTGKAGVPTAEVSQSPQALRPRSESLRPKGSLELSKPVPALSATPAQPTPAPPPVEQEPEVQTEEKPVDLTVTAEREAGGYQVPDATTTTKTDTPILDIPASIQVIPRQVLEDQQVTPLEEALQNSSSVIYNSIDTASDVNFSIRGFDQAPILEDGFRQYNFVEIPQVANIERIEILKGPASILYGKIQPGGVISLVIERPLSSLTVGLVL